MDKKVAVLQMTSSANLVENLENVRLLLDRASKQNVLLALLPENFAFMGFSESAKLAIAEPFGEGIIQQTISELAKKYNMWIVAGSIPLLSKEPNRCFASCLVFDDKGQCVKRYDKIHLFDVQVSETEAHKESNATCPGSELAVIDTPVGKVGLSICYDLRFPEMYRKLRALDADIFVVPAAFTFDTGKVHWQILLQARAIENLSYVLAANQGGSHENGRQTYGHSIIISPWGNIEASCSASGLDLAITDIDLESMQSLRKRFPCLTHQKL